MDSIHFLSTVMDFRCLWCWNITWLVLNMKLMAGWISQKKIQEAIKFWKTTSFFWRGTNINSLPETNIAPENGWLEYYFPIGMAYFQVQTVSFREGRYEGTMTRVTCFVFFNVSTQVTMIKYKHIYHGNLRRPPQCHPLGVPWKQGPLESHETRPLGVPWN